MNRRALLVAAGSSLALAGCRGRDDDDQAGAPVSETSRRGDVELLQELVAAKEAALRAYSERHAPDGFVAVEREHRSRLQRALRDRGGRPPAAAPAPAGGGVGRGEALDRMIEAEWVSIAQLVDVIPKLGDPDLRTLAAQMLTVEAQQLAVLRARAGSPPMPDAFVYGGRPG